MLVWADYETSRKIDHSLSGSTAIGKAGGEDQFRVRIRPEPFVIVKGVTVIVIEHPEALDVLPKFRMRRYFTVHHSA